MRAKTLRFDPHTLSVTTEKVVKITQLWRRFSFQ